MREQILAIDQGTTSSRSLLFSRDLQILDSAQQEFTQYYPQSGWVEHDAEQIWRSVLSTAKQVLSGREAQVAAIGITNQRETTVLWERSTGRPIGPAIVWQDRRTQDLCQTLRASGVEPMVVSKTGLLLDPYFSATKIAWLLDNVPGARAQAQAGELAFGTMDSFLIWRLTNGQAHVTDATNAARTMLYNIHDGCWDADLLKLLNIPESLMPEVRDSAADFGRAEASVLGVSLPICGVAGDQQAATIGQACFQPGMLKSTYGTGCFALLNTGDQAVHSNNRLLTTIAYQLNGKVCYALEGSIFIAGAAVQWLRDGLRMIHHATQAQGLAEHADPEQQLYLVPAFTGLGAPYWDTQARGALFGLARNSGPKEIARAALQAVGYQTRDLLMAMRKDWQTEAKTVLRVDGGMSASDWTMQFLADILDAPVDRPAMLETTALGAAYLAALQSGLAPAPDEFAASWASAQRFAPNMSEDVRARLYGGWQDAVARTLTAKSAG